jgi:hypothetical protein
MKFLERHRLQVGMFRDRPMKAHLYVPDADPMKTLEILAKRGSVSILSLEGVPAIRRLEAWKPTMQHALSQDMLDTGVAGDA